MYIAIKINVTGDSCEGCKFYSISSFIVRCPFWSIELEQKVGDAWDLHKVRLPKCKAATIPVQCASCNNYGQEECTNCFSRKNEDWIPHTEANR